MSATSLPIPLQATAEYLSEMIDGFADLEIHLPEGRILIQPGTFSEVYDLLEGEAKLCQVALLDGYTEDRIPVLTTLQGILDLMGEVAAAGHDERVRYRRTIENAKAQQRDAAPEVVER